MTTLLRRENPDPAALRAFRQEFDVSPERAASVWRRPGAAAAEESLLRARCACMWGSLLSTRWPYATLVSVDAPRILNAFRVLDALEKELDAHPPSGTRDAGRFVIWGRKRPPRSPLQLDRLLGGMGEKFDLSACGDHVEAGRPTPSRRKRSPCWRAGASPG